MKYQKLQQIWEKKRKYVKWGQVLIAISSVVMTILAINTIWAATSDSTLNESLIIVQGVIIFGSVFTAIVLGRLEESKISCAEDYFVIKIMDTINEYGVDSGKFEVIKMCNQCYKIAFHNQTIDYDKLQGIIDCEVEAMNKIMSTRIRVKLI